MGRLDGKVAILSGGGRGIGRATVEMMVAEGAKVTFTDINVENGQAVADSLGDNAMFIEQDVTDSASWPKVVAATKERFGLINVLVNNVGWVTLDDADIEHESDEGWRNIIAINMDSVFYACRTIVPEMREAGGGSIVNISSMAGKLGTPSMVAYGAAKAGVWEMTKSVALHGGRGEAKIRCNSIHPGLIQTPLGLGVLGTHKGGDPSETVARWVKGTPMGRPGEPEDIAYAVIFLASDESSYITGVDIPVDGGRQAG
ncbi:MAG: glucose 1-dehydrogenase [Porticoccaceae bacterium]|nr:glucose 1-dehydrogenase [Porticoccaceae bacterium]